MTALDPRTITRLLRDSEGGDAGAARTLLPLVYEELQALARPIFLGERCGHTLQPTAVIHEAWLKIAKHVDRIEDRGHFFAVASQAMRRVLTDHVRRRKRLKRGGARERITLDHSLVASDSKEFDLVDLEDSLARLSRLNARHARVVELRIFGGLTVPEAAQVLGVGRSTVESDWFMAKSWLRTELSHAP